MSFLSFKSYGDGSYLTGSQAYGLRYQDHFLPQGILQTSRCWPMGFSRG